jgi:hypothetical protein
MTEADLTDSIEPSAQWSISSRPDGYDKSLNGSDEARIVYLSELSQLVGLCAWWAFKTWGKYNPSYNLTKRIENFTQHCNCDRIPLTVLYLNEEGLPLGMASLRDNDGIRPDLSPWLGSVYVDTLYRGKGIGSRLVREVQNIARQLGYEQVYLLTYEDTLPLWYSRLGWQEIGKDSCHGNPVTVMQIDLFE